MSTLRVISIDPGSYNLGLSKTEVSTYTYTPVRIDTLNVRVDKLPIVGPYQSYGVYNDNGKQYALYNYLYAIMCEYKPHHLAVETPFYSALRPNAFKSLLTTMNTINDAYLSYNNYGKVFGYAPVQVKSSLGVSSKDGKDGIKDKLFSMAHISTLLNKCDKQYSEHELDAVAVSLTHCKNLITHGESLWLSKQ